ncbi:family 43 glycosylhydrolase [Flavobacterium ovatum]|uniref:family 43 glycosylhydrolase n=1 Tax=Flavobacterium ovatum TaxID=1928857 RepID=UPI00344DCDAD
MFKKCLYILLLLVLTHCQSSKQMDAMQTTVCNPMDLNYRFSLDGVSRREGADPTVVLYQDEYYLFASKSGGYWNSKDLIHWDFITSTDLPFEDYAPTAVVIKNTLYFMASNNKAPISIYKTTNPKSGKWDVANANFPIAMTDPDLFLDDDRLYLYYGCSNVDPIYAVELDLKTLNPISKPIECFNSNKAIYGWEQYGDYNDQPGNPWIEGAWMNKYKGKYYLQYAGPGTRFKSYSDGLYVADHPLGPFTIAKHNPISIKPEGFATGAGHGSTFEDKYGNFWHIATMVLTVKDKFERRLGLFPAFFDKDGVLATYTTFGDFPIRIPTKKVSQPEALFPEWMLLSYGKPISVSSEIEGHEKNNASDEEIRTYWSAKTGNLGEWISIDLQKEAVVKAVQINYAENDTHLYGYNSNQKHQYLLEYSVDNKNWKTAVDNRKNQKDVPHDYVQLAKSIKARYLKLTNYSVPDGTFALADFRIFGNAQGKSPAAETDFSIIRNSADKRAVTLQWKPQNDAIGHNVRYGIAPDKLYHTYQVLNKKEITIRTLNANQTYYFTVDAFNENGIAKGTKVVELR